MDPSAIRAPGGDRWLKRAEQVSDAFGLVFGLVVVTYVLTSLLGNQGWDSVVVMLAVSVTSVAGTGPGPQGVARARDSIGTSLYPFVIANGEFSPPANPKFRFRPKVIA